jgi:hypothetical protein
MHTRFVSPETQELYGDLPSPPSAERQVWKQLSRLPLDDQLAGRVLTPPKAPETPVKDFPSPNQVSLEDDLMDGSIPMYQLAAMIGKMRDGTPEPPSQPSTPSCLRRGLTGYSMTPPRHWWKDESPPPRRHPRKYLEDDPSFTYDESRTVFTPDGTIQSGFSAPQQSNRVKELLAQIKALKEGFRKDPPEAQE